MTYSNGLLYLPMPPPGVTISQQPHIRAGLSGYRLSLDSQLRLTVLSFDSSYNCLCMDLTENTVSLLTWMTWCQVFHCSGTVCLVLDRMATPLPMALLLLRDVTAVAEMMCLPSCSLTTAISLFLLFCLSGVTSHYVCNLRSSTELNLTFWIIHFCPEMDLVQFRIKKNKMKPDDLSCVHRELG
jgi:hypothetical protein